MSIVPKRIFARLLKGNQFNYKNLMKGLEITNMWIYFQLLNNFKKIWNLLNERRFFSLFHCEPDFGGRGNLIFGKAASLSLRASRKGGVAISSFKRKKRLLPRLASQ
jgi:hypothetical protein